MQRSLTELANLWKLIGIHDGWCWVRVMPQKLWELKYWKCECALNARLCSCRNRKPRSNHASFLKYESLRCACVRRPVLLSSTRDIINQSQSVCLWREVVYQSAISEDSISRRHQTKCFQLGIATRDLVNWVCAWFQIVHSLFSTRLPLSLSNPGCHTGLPELRYSSHTRAHKITIEDFGLIFMRDLHLDKKLFRSRPKGVVCASILKSKMIVKWLRVQGHLFG